MQTGDFRSCFQGRILGVGDFPMSFSTGADAGDPSPGTKAEAKRGVDAAS